HLEDGDYFGEISLLKNVPRNATIRTVTASVMLTLHREIFQILLDRAPEIRNELERTVQVRTQEEF
ncbi:MAG TPA: cyclic nucleotide-binding domain-containing protein, partial [Acidobacteriota bacterium]